MARLCVKVQFNNSGSKLDCLFCLSTPTLDLASWLGFKTDGKTARQGPQFHLTSIQLSIDFALLEKTLDCSKLLLGSQT
jgi:hypothetical protein